jgi:predicted Zn-dependent peptidase
MKKYTLDSGLRLVVEPLPHLRSVTSGIWVNCGSVYEDDAVLGVSHFLEHMLFKGTPKRDALAIASEMEAVGGVLNAFTGKEHTCYYARSLDEHFPLQLDLLADMYCNSLLDPTEFNREKKVIVEEINMYEDSPDEVAMDLFISALYPSHSYGPPIVGSLESVNALTPQQLSQHYRCYYNPSNSVLAVAGKVEPEQVLELAERYFAGFSGGEPAPETPIPLTAPGSNYAFKDIEQSHVCLGFPGVTLADDDYYAATIIANALGGGASSRLFQEVREKRGLAYSAYSYLEAYVKGGFIMSYAATAPKNSGELIRVMAEQFLLLRDQGLSSQELKQSKDQLKGNLLLNMENTANVMSKLGRAELALHRNYDIEETTARLMAVSEDDISRVIARMIVPEQLVLTQVGPEQTPFDVAKI